MTAPDELPPVSCWTHSLEIPAPSHLTGAGKALQTPETHLSGCVPFAGGIPPTNFELAAPHDMLSVSLRLSTSISFPVPATMDTSIPFLDFPEEEPTSFKGMSY